VVGEILLAVMYLGLGYIAVAVLYLALKTLWIMFGPQPKNNPYY
jgi:hypothetical protein